MNVIDIAFLLDISNLRKYVAFPVQFFRSLPKENTRAALIFFGHRKSFRGYKTFTLPFVNAEHAKYDDWLLGFSSLPSEDVSVADALSAAYVLDWNPVAHKHIIFLCGGCPWLETQVDANGEDALRIVNRLRREGIIFHVAFAKESKVLCKTRIVDSSLFFESIANGVFRADAAEKWEESKIQRFLDDVKECIQQMSKKKIVQITCHNPYRSLQDMLLLRNLKLAPSLAVFISNNEEEE